jgi:hypothetical protein
MGKRIHRPCPWRTRRKFGGAFRDFCTVQGDHYPDAPFCEYCADWRRPVRKPSKLNRKDKP